MTEASLVMLMTMMAQVGISRPSRITEKKKKPRMSRLLGDAVDDVGLQARKDDAARPDGCDDGAQPFLRHMLWN